MSLPRHFEAALSHALRGIYCTRLLTQYLHCNIYIFNPIFAPYLDEIHGGVFQGDVYIGSTIINQVDPTQAGMISMLVKN